MLKLNPDRTEFMLRGSSSIRHKLASFFTTKILGNDIFPADVVKNLCINFESDHSFTAHISNVCHSCYYHLKDFHRIRKHLNLFLTIWYQQHKYGQITISSECSMLYSMLPGLSNPHQSPHKVPHYV